MEEGEIPSRLRDSCASAIVDAVIILTKERAFAGRGGAWWAVSQCVRAIEHLGHNYFKIRDKVRERWFLAIPLLCVWIVHTFEAILLPDIETGDSEGLVLSAYHALNLVYTFDEGGERSADIIGSYETLKLVTRVWLRPDASIEECAFASHCLHMVFLSAKSGPVCQPGTRHIMQAIAADLEITADEVVRLALTRLQNAGNSAQMQLLAFVPLLYPSQVGTPVFQQTVLDQRGVQIVLRTIRNIFEDIEFDFGSPDGSATHNRGRGDDIECSFGYIRNATVPFELDASQKGPPLRSHPVPCIFLNISYYLAAWERRRDLHPRHIEKYNSEVRAHSTSPYWPPEGLSLKSKFWRHTWNATKTQPAASRRHCRTRHCAMFGRMF